MSQRKYNLHDWTLLILGFVGLCLIIYGTIFDIKNSCDSSLIGVKTNDTVIIGAILALAGAFYKSIVKFLQNKFQGEKK